MTAWYYRRVYIVIHGTGAKDCIMAENIEEGQQVLFLWGQGAMYGMQAAMNTTCEGDETFVIVRCPNCSNKRYRQIVHMNKLGFLLEIPPFSVQAGGKDHSVYLMEEVVVEIGLICTPIARTVLSNVVLLDQRATHNLQQPA